MPSFSLIPNIPPLQKHKIYIVARETIAFFLQVFIVLPVFFVAGLAAQALFAVRELPHFFTKKQAPKFDQKQETLNVLITGASAGLGRALAFEYAQRAETANKKLHLVLIARKRDSPAANLR